MYLEKVINKFNKKYKNKIGDVTDYIIHFVEDKEKSEKEIDLYLSKQLDIINKFKIGTKFKRIGYNEIDVDMVINSSLNRNVKINYYREINQNQSKTNKLVRMTDKIEGVI
jgi:hypothetical protein